MADRNWHDMRTQGVRHVQLNMTVKLVSGSPVFVEGDKAAAIAGSYFTMVDTGTGVITFTTNDPWLAVVGIQATRIMGTPGGTATAIVGLPTQNATTKKWSFTVNTFTGASAADMATGDMVAVGVTLRNSQVLP